MRVCVPQLLALCLCLTFAGACATADAETLKHTFDRGLAAYDAGRYEEAFKIFHSIDDMDLAAMRNEALMLRKGQGVEKDPEAAEAMYERAAQGGLPTAAADLADMLLKGEAGPPNPKKALPWLELAAAAHHPIAQYELGQLFEDGTVVPKNMAAARQLYIAAADAGLAETKERLAARPADTEPTPLELRK